MANEPATKLLLAKIIIKNLKKEFEDVHLSGNLADTIKLVQKRINNEVYYEVQIPAQIYDIGLYRKRGVIVHTGAGSYADIVNTSGGFSGKHTDYVDRCIQKSIQEWASLSKIKIEVD
nr:MAG TPA: hypothetical protein [Bacteriophage sp.]